MPNQKFLKHLKFLFLTQSIDGTVVTTLIVRFLTEGLMIEMFSCRNLHVWCRADTETQSNACRVVYSKHIDYGFTFALLSCYL